MLGGEGGEFVAGGGVSVAGEEGEFLVVMMVWCHDEGFCF